MKFKIKIAKVLNVGNSYLITLPKNWVQQYNLKTGDYLTMFLLKDGSLKLQANKEDSLIEINEEDSEFDLGDK
jgi:antitoxin component of MazEF toxin-antitoxin module